MADEQARVLIIEPSELFKKVIDNIISHYHLNAIYCQDETAALETVKSEPIDLVITANALPQSDGMQLSKQLRDHLPAQAIILLLVSTATNQLIHQAIKSGITDVIERHAIEAIEYYLESLFKAKVQAENQTINILSVEDAQSVLDITEAHMLDVGFTITSVRSAEEAIKQLEQQSFDVVLVDLLLEGKKNGIGLIHWIRQLNDERKNLPIIVISGLQNTDLRLEAFRSGAVDFINKPVNFLELEIRVRNVVKSHRLLCELQQKEAKLQKMVVTDPLTRLYNRYYLNEFGFSIISEAKRHQQPLSLLVIDIDNFKLINDNMGHEAGDAVLKSIATLLKRSCRSEDFAIRFGGEEFVIVLPYSTPADAYKKAEKIREKIEQLNPQDIPVTVSIGVAGVTSQQAKYIDFNRLFGAADDAVYQAKINGRNCVVLSDTFGLKRA